MKLIDLCGSFCWIFGKWNCLFSMWFFLALKISIGEICAGEEKHASILKGGEDM